jgi:hypothetical protein
VTGSEAGGHVYAVMGWAGLGWVMCACCVVCVDVAETCIGDMALRDTGQRNSTVGLGGAVCAVLDAAWSLVG